MQQDFNSSDGAASDQFGDSVALDGDTAVVGSRYVRVGSNQAQGAAYIFFRSGTLWSQEQKLVARDGQAQDLFGYAVALEGDTAIITAPSATIDDNHSQGAAYVFSYEGGSWKQKQKLSIKDDVANEHLGVSVAVDDDTALFGSWSTIDGQPQQGAVTIFTRDNGAWSEGQRLIAA